MQEDTLPKVIYGAAWKESAIAAIDMANQLRHYSELTANRKVWGHNRPTRIAPRLHKTPAQIIFRFATVTGIISLIGKTNKKICKKIYKYLTLI